MHSMSFFLIIIGLMSVFLYVGCYLEYSDIYQQVWVMSCVLN